MRKLILLSLLFCLSATVYVSAQSKPTQKELLEPTYNNSKTLINTGKYQFVGDAVYNDVTREMLDKAINSLSINKSEASGEIVSLSTEKKNIKVKGAIENYKVLFDDEKQHISIQFNVESNNFDIKVIANGNAFLTLNSAVNNINQVGKIERI